MNSRTTLSLFVGLVLLCGFPGARAQDGGPDISQFVLPLHNGGFIAFKLELAPVGEPKAATNLNGIQAALTPQVMLDDDHVVHRVLVDAEGNLVFGYDLVVEPVGASKQFKVSVQPLSLEFERQLRARRPVAAHRSAPGVSTLAHPAAAQLIDDGDAFALDLLVNAQTGVKIVDIVKVSFDRAKLWVAPRSVPARDFTLGNVELAVRDYRLTINGELAGGGKQTRGCAGALVWFYVPDRGRFIFSLMPREGYDFQKVGRIEGHKISFKSGDDVYEWTSSAPIVGSGGGNWNLWVLHDTAYVPDFTSTAQIMESAEAKQQANKENSSPGWTQGSLALLRRERRADSEARRAARTKPAGRRPRALVGGADRIENLLPKQ